MAAKRAEIKQQIADEESQLVQLRASLALEFFRGRLREDPNTGSLVIPNLKGFIGNIEGLSCGGSGGVTGETLGPHQSSSAACSESLSIKSGGRLGPVQAVEMMSLRTSDPRQHAREQPEFTEANQPSRVGDFAVSSASFVQYSPCLVSGGGNERQ